MEARTKKTEEIVQKKLESLSRKNRYQEIISIVTQSVHQSIDLQTVLDNSIEAMRKNIDKLDIVAIYLVEGNDLVVKAQEGFTEEFIKRAGSIPYPKGATWKTIIDKKSIYTPDIDKDKTLGQAGRDMGVQCYLIVPLFIDNEAVGTLGIVSYEKNVFDEEEIDLLEIVSKQISIAVRNAKQAEALKKSEGSLTNTIDILSKRNKYEEIINTVTRSVHSSINLQEVLDNSIEAMIKNIDKLDIIALYLIEGDDVVLKAHRGFTDDYLKRAGRIPYPKGVTWKTIIEEKSIYIPDVELDNALGQAGKDMGFKCYLIVPLFIDGKVVGTVAIVSYEKNVFEEQELKLLDIVSKQIGIAIRNAKQAEAIKASEESLKYNIETLYKRNRYQEIISTVTSSVHSSIDLDIVMQNAVDAIHENIDHAENVGIFIVEGDDAVNKANRGYSKELLNKVKKIAKPKGFTWKTITEGRLQYCNDVENDSIIGPAGRKEGTKSYASMPIKSNEQTIGCICINSFEKNSFDQDFIILLEIVAQQIEVAINNASQAEQLKKSREELSISRDHFRLLVETTNIIPWEAQAKSTRYSYVGPQAEQLLGYSIEQWYQEGFWPSHVHPDDLEEAKSKCRQLTQAGKDHELEYRMVSKSGEIVWIYEVISVTSENGEPKYIRGFMIDITKRKEAEELAAQLGNILEESLNEVYIIDAETLEFIQVNEGARKNLGYTLEELQQMTSPNIKRGLSKKDVFKALEPILSGEVENLTLRATHVRKDGTTYPIETYLQMSNFKGRRVIVANVLDITERERSNSILLNEKNILEMISQGEELSDILEQICIASESQSDDMLCSFLLVDKTGKSLLTCAAPNLPQDYLDNTKVVPIAEGIGSCGTASYRKEQVIVSDIENDPLWADFYDLASRNGLKACWSTPILSKDDSVLGTFAMYYSEPRSPNDSELDTIERATHLSRIAIERKNDEETLNENLQRISKKSRYEEVINAVSESVHQSLELDEVFTNAVKTISKEITEAKNVVIYMVEGEMDNPEKPPFAVMKANRGHSKEYIKRVRKIPYPKGATWKAIIDGEKRYVSDTELDEAIGPAGKEFGTRSYLSMPLKYINKTVGVLHIHSSKQDAFSQDDIKLLEIVTTQLENAINNASKAQALKESQEILQKNLEQLSKKQRYEEIISTVTRSVHRSIDLNQVLENAANALHKSVNHTDHVAIYLVEGDNAILKSFTGFPKWFIDKVACIPKPKGFTWKTILDGKPCYVPDVRKDKIIGPAGRKVGTLSYASMPIKQNYTTIGCINISARVPNAFDEDEIKLLEIVASQIETAVNNASQAEALKISREELRESREHFRLLVETTSVIPWEYDPDTNRFTYVGPQAERLLGYPLSSWYEEDFWHEHIHEEDRDKIFSKYLSATQALRDHELEYRMISKNGSVVWIYDMSSVISENGKAKMLRGFMIDISERKTVEYEKLEAQERYRTLIEHSYDIIVETNLNGTFLYINPTFNEVLGYEEGELLGRSLFEHIHEDDAAEAITQFSRVIKEFKKGTATYRFMHKSGEWRWLESVGSPFRTAKGERRTVISSRDITERMESDKKLQDAFSEIETLKDRLEKENVYLMKEIELTYSHADIIGQSKAIKSALNEIEQVATTDSTVLLTGETGTGKELFANRIHSLSKRKDRAMIKVNCAALPPHLIESELFGHEKGAFTGAVSKSIGRFEVADDSTIFLDEVGELPLELQSKLLRVLQEGELQRVGSSKTIKVNVRVITASNNELYEAVTQGKFREDLFYRLNVFPINIPPLRERKEDIPDLLWFFISEFEEKMGKTIKNISRKDMENLINYPWPGNVRQLRNVIERAMIISPGPDLQIELPGIRSETPMEVKPIVDVEREHISQILNMTNWRIRGKHGAAEILGLKPTTLESRIKRLGIKRSH